MSDIATIVFPATVEELKLEIGKSILRHGSSSLGMPQDQIDYLVDRSPDAYHIEAAVTIRAAQFEETMSALAFIAERGLEALKHNDTDEALMAMLPEMASSPDVVGFLSDVPYLGQLFAHLSDLDADRLDQVLHVIRDYATGG